VSVVVLAILVAGACTDAPRRARPQSTPAPSRPEGAALPQCDNRVDVLSKAAPRESGRISADLDGRGGSELAWITVTRTAHDDCRAWLVVEGSAGRIAAPIAGTDPFALASLGLPALNGAVTIDRQPGTEILVDVTAGASTTFVGVFAVHRESVVRIAVVGRGAPPGNLFPYGGSVGHLDAVDCAGEGSVVATRAQAGARRYLVSRHYFAATGSVWRARPALTKRARARFAELESRWPEFGSSPFLSCGT
jgi:hypothetical protein